MNVGMLIGFGIAVVGYSLGHFTGYLMGIKVRNVTTLFARPEETRRCLCGHQVTSHLVGPKGSRLQCNAALRDNGENPCACRGYVAKPDPVVRSESVGLLQL